MGAAKSLWTDDMRERLRMAWFDEKLTMEEVGLAVGKSATTCRNEAQRIALPVRHTIRGLYPSAIARVAALPPRQPRPRPLQPGARTIPLLPSEASAMADSLAWTCRRCGHWCWNHYEHCAQCGQAKPTPPPDEKPSDEARPEPPWR